MEFCLDAAEFSLNSVNSGNVIHHWNMNWGQFKDPLWYQCLPCTVIASLSLTQEVAGLNTAILLTLHFYRQGNFFSLSVHTSTGGVSHPADEGGGTPSQV